MSILDDFLRENDEEDFRIKRERYDRLRKAQEQKRKREVKAEQAMSPLDRFTSAFNQSMGEGREIHREAFQDARKVRGQDIEAPRISQNLGTNPTFTRARDTLHGVPFLGSADADYQARIDKGLGLKSTLEGRAGQALGTLGNDIVQDRTRGLWWLLNAPQAIASVTQEAMLAHAAPGLYASDFVHTGRGENLGKAADQGGKGQLVPVPSSTEEEDKVKYLIDNDYASLSPDNQLRFKGDYGKRTRADGNTFVTKKRYGSGSVDLLLAPTATAVNAGIGLLNPFGGNEGYEAVLPSASDPTKTSNVIGEIGAKYILGRTGNLLNWNEFKEVRPDVSKEEYNRYKAFKWDKGLDLNIFDGDFTLPTGVLKGTTEGIHGPEIQFLGRSLPIATTILPTVFAAAGTAFGAGLDPEELRGLQYETDDVTDPITGKVSKRELKKGKKRFMTADEKLKYQKVNRIRNGLIGGFSALAGGSVLGNIIEQERRRRNAAENLAEGGNAEMYLG